MSTAASRTESGRNSEGPRIIESVVDSLGQVGALVCGRARLEEAHVHEARKTLKKIRAGLRLLADAAHVDLARPNELCRDVGRLLSGLRDIDVCLLTLESLPQLPADQSGILADRLKARRDEIHASLRADPAEDARIAEDLAGVERALRDLVPADLTHGRLAAAVDMARQLGAERCRALQTDDSEEAFHSLRKAAKRELYQRRLLAEAAGRPDPRLELLDALGEHLGRHQDLSVLREVAVEVGALGDAIARTIEEEILAERQRCLALADRAYPEDPH